VKKDESVRNTNTIAVTGLIRHPSRWTKFVMPHWVVQARACAMPIIFGLFLCVWSAVGAAEDLPIIKDPSINDFQNRMEDAKPYDFDAPPQGLFRSITMAEGFEEELGYRRTHEIVPVKPTERFRPDVPGIFIVFTLHQHYQAFQVFGRCYAESVPGLDPHTVIGQDAMYIALEDESGYLKLSSPLGRWKPGRYKVEIHAGEQVNEVSLMGTMRFTVAASDAP
jgi:hypothetical protein